MAQDRLTAPEEEFIRVLLADPKENKTAAYRKAYPAKAQKWKESTLNEYASRLFAKPKIQERYNALRDKAAARAEKKAIITRERLIQKLANIVLANGTDFATVELEEVEIDGETLYRKVVNVKPTREIPDEKRDAIASISQGPYGIKVETVDPKSAMSLLCELMGWTSNKIEVNTTINNENPVKGLTTEELRKLAGL